MLGFGKARRTPAQQIEAMTPYFIGCSANYILIERSAQELSALISIDARITYDLIMMRNVYGLVFAWICAFRAHAPSYDAASAMTASYPRAARVEKIGRAEDVEQSVIFLRDALALASRTILPLDAEQDIEAYVQGTCSTGTLSTRNIDQLNPGVRAMLTRRRDWQDLIRGALGVYIEHARREFSGIKIIERE